MPEQGSKKTSTLLLIMANVAVIILAIWQNWSFGNMLWIYWYQSVIIGIFHFFRLLFFKGQFEPTLLRLNDPKVDGSLRELPLSVGWGSNIFVALFFALHYGFFHYGYASFLILMPNETFLSILTKIWPAVLIFTINHLLSLFLNLVNDKNDSKSMAELFAEPYKRIMPMHLIIMIYGFLVASYSGLTLLPWGQTIEFGRFPEIVGIFIFSVLKIYADVFGHNQKHKEFSLER